MKYARFFVFTLVAALTIVAALGAANLAKAASRSWSANATDQLASGSQNWGGGAVPVSGDALTLPAGSVVTWDLSGVVPSSLITSANLTLTSPLIVSGALSLSGGSLKSGSQPVNAGGDMAISGGSLESGAAPINVSGNWNFTSGSVSLAASTVTMNGATAKTIVSGGRHFGGLTIASANGSVTANDDLNVDGAFTVADGLFDVGGRVLTVMGGLNISGGSLLVGGGTVVLSGSLGRPLVISGGTLSANAASTIEYRPVAGSVTVEPAVYGNLMLTGKNVFSLSGNTAVANALTVSSDATLSLGGHVLDIAGGAIVNAGTITDGIIRSPVASVRVLNAGGADISTIKSSSGTISVQVNDQDLNRRGASIENVSAALTITTMGGDRETVSMNETAAASGIFASIPLIVHQGASVAQNGQIETGQNDIIFVKYADPQDPADTKNVQVAVSLASGVSAGAPQIVDGPRVTNWSGVNVGSGMTYAAHIVWSTDRESASAVTVTSSQLTSPITAGSLTGVTEHDVVVSGLVRGREYSYTVSSVTSDGKTVASQAKKFAVIVPGDRIKTAASSAVYWYLGGKRNVFSDLTVYSSWFSDFKGVVTVPSDQLSDIDLGRVVPIRAGTYLVKIQSDPRTYAVEPFGRLRWIQTEAKALALYGQTWSQRVRDVDVSQFVNYSLGDALAASDIPSGFIYKLAGNELNAVVGKTTRPLSESDRKVNGIFSQFASSVAPSVVSELISGGAVNGYYPDLNGVLKDGAAEIAAPAFGV